MRVLQINSVCGYGSTGNIVVDLYHALREQGHECCIAYGRGSAPEDVESYRIGSGIDVYIHGICSRITDRQAFYSTRATRRFVQWMKEYDPDVIHMHNLHGYYINIEILFDALKQMEKPVVWTLHDCWAFTGHCAHFEYQGCDRWKKGCGKCPQKHNYPASYLLDQSKGNYQQKKTSICQLKELTIVSPSQWLANLVKQSFLRRYSLQVIHNGIDVEIFSPMQTKIKEQYGIDEKKVVLGVASEWSSRKGIQDFAKLADVLDENYQIVLIGRVYDKADKKNITYISRTSSRRELAEWYSAAEVLFNPTYEDNYPTVNLEAQACGTPVITYNTGGSPEGVRMGWCVEKGDLLGVQHILKEGKSIQTDLDRMIWGKEYMTEKYLGIYKQNSVGWM